MYDDIMKQLEERAKRFGPMRDANGYAKVHGECGDIVEVWLRIDGGRIRKSSFLTDGCGYSKHCCSTAICMSEGMTVAQADAMSGADVLEKCDPIPEDHLHCADLAADTVHAAVESFKSGKVKGWRPKFFSR